MNGDDAKLLEWAKRCRWAYTAGEWASLLLGLGRMAYAGIAKGASMYYMAQGATMEGAEAMSALRNTLKAVFRLNPWTKFRVYSFAEVVAKYGTAEAIIAAAGRTSTKFNVLGALAAIGSTKELASKEKCKCR